MNDPWLVRREEFPAKGTRREQLEFLLRYAILAPSAHNSQPWRFVLRQDAIEIWADPERALPICDPFQRELIMSCGAALYHLRLAGACLGIPLKVEIPMQESRLAVASLDGPVSMCPLWRRQFEAIPFRRTDRQRFKPRPVPGLDHLKRLFEAGFPPGFAPYATPVRMTLITDEDERAELADQIEEAAREQWNEKAFRQELAGWIRGNGRDGLTLGLPPWLVWFPRWALRFWNPGKSMAHDEAGLAEEGPVLALVSTESDTRKDWLAAGEALAALLLSARAMGLSASFFHQPIQLPAHRKKLAEHLKAPFPQALLRLGYGAGCRATPRRAVSELVEVDLTPPAEPA